MYKFVSSKVCPRCNLVNRFETNQNWLHRCKSCSTIFSNVPVTCNEMQGGGFDDPVECKSLMQDFPLTDEQSWAKAFDHVVTAIDAARTLQSRGDYEAAIVKSTRGFTILGQMQQVLPSANVDRVSLSLVLYSIRATCCYATGITENWNQALEDIAHATSLAGMYRNLPSEAGKALQVIENIHKVIEQRRHTDSRPTWMD